MPSESCKKKEKSLGDKFDKWAYNGPKILPSTKGDLPVAKKKKDVIDLDSGSDEESSRLKKNKNI
jgi:hypothetical protein